MPNRSGPIRTKARSWRSASLACPAALAALAALALGCGIPTDGEPRALPERVGASGTEPDTSTTIGTGVGTDEAFVWYWDSASKRLVPVRRSIDSSNPTAVVAAALAAQTSREYEQGLTSKIPEGTTLLNEPTIDSGTISVNLSAKLNQLNAQAQREAFAQIVLTASQISRVDRVAFSIDGSPVDVTSPEGQTTEVSPCDFRDVLANDEVMSATGRTERETEYGRNITRVLNSLCLE